MTLDTPHFRFFLISLNIFLSMSMMSIQLWVLSGSLTLIFFTLFAQVLGMTLFAAFLVTWGFVALFAYQQGDIDKVKYIFNFFI